MINIITALQQATAGQIETGFQWYSIARAWCMRIGYKYNINPRTVAYMIAVMSPRNRWEWNLQDVINILHAVKTGINPMTVTCHSFNKNKIKTIKLARGEPYTITGQKVSAFIDNIINPASDRITVDVWAYRVWIGDYTAPPKIINPKLYALIEADYKQVAKMYSLKGYELQAIVWSVARDTGKPFNLEIPESI